MMDSTTETLASYASSIHYEQIPPDVVKKAKSLLIDTLGCGIAGYGSEASKIARRIAGRIHRCEFPATILGSGRKSSMDLAAFANGVMIRCLDFNDAYFSREGGHPSDNFAPILTCADAVHAGGREVIVASVLAYEVFCRLCDHLSLVPRGIDHATTGVISSVVGTSKILGLSREQMVEAINLAIAPNISLWQTRSGEISMWKNCALANAGRNAVFAALLAKEGMTGPSPIFEGRAGFFKAVSGPFRLQELGGGAQPFRILKAMIKRHPCGQFAQTAIDAALKLRSRISDVNDIAGINIGTCDFGKKAMGNDDEKWHPRTRESADHSLPYATAVALLYGPPELNHFSTEYLDNPDLRHLMEKTTVEATEECNGLYPEANASRVEIMTKGGETYSELVQFPRGHYKNSLTDEELEQKFMSLTRDLLEPATRNELLSMLWNLEQIEDVGKMMAFTGIRSSGRETERIK